MAKYISARVAIRYEVRYLQRGNYWQKIQCPWRVFFLLMRNAKWPNRQSRLPLMRPLLRIRSSMEAMGIAMAEGKEV